MDDRKVNSLLQPIGLKPLNKVWAKLKIFLGLACVFLGLLMALGPQSSMRPFGSAAESVAIMYGSGLLLFVLGGYLAMAGHRSHLYQSQNTIAAFLIEEIRKSSERTVS